MAVVATYTRVGLALLAVAGSALGFALGVTVVLVVRHLGGG